MQIVLSLLLFCSQLHCLWSSLLFLWSDRWAIQQYHSWLRVSLPVSTRVSTRGKEDIAVWGGWKVESWPSESLYRLFLYSFILIQYLYILDSYSCPEKSLSTAAAVAITAIVCSLVVFIAGTVCGALLTVCISRWNKKRCSSKPAPNTEEQQQTVAVYEEVDTQSKKIELHRQKWCFRW